MARLQFSACSLKVFVKGKVRTEQIKCNYFYLYMSKIRHHHFCLFLFNDLARSSSNGFPTFLIRFCKTFIQVDHNFFLSNCSVSFSKAKWWKSPCVWSSRVCTQLFNLHPEKWFWRCQLLLFRVWTWKKYRVASTLMSEIWFF